MTSQRSVLRRILARPAGWIPALWLGLLVAAAIFGNWLSPYDPNQADFTALFESPSTAHWLGTDELGRDTLSRLIAATRVALLAGGQAVGIGVLMGVPIGLFVGYAGGWWDRIGMRLVDAAFSLPGLVLAFAIVALLGPGLTNAMFAVGFLFSLRFIRLTRGSVLSVREEPFIEAARLSGAPTHRILSRYLLPNVAAPLIVQISVSLAAVLLIEAGLSFLGLGVQAPDATWGTMLREARANQSQGPWLPWAPGLAITLTVLAFNTLGDRLRDTLAEDPSHVIAGPSADVVGLPVSLPAATVGLRSDVGSSPRGAAIEVEPTSDALLEVRGLTLTVPTSAGMQPAVQGLNFEVGAGEIVALVGESGSGKTLSAMAIAGLLPSAVKTHEDSVVRFDGMNLLGLSESELRSIRSGSISFVFQDPTTSLNPSLTIGYQIAEPFRVHQGMSKKQALERSAELLDRVGVPNPKARLRDYPHQFSGGMAQRVMIAIALAGSPRLLIADEPTTALDVTTQRQVLELLVGICDEEGMAMLFITHDLGVVAEVADRAVVMYAGEAVEKGDVFDVFERPAHPYTSALLGSVALMDGEVDRLVTISGRVPAPSEPLDGCRFAPRCSVALPSCAEEAPPVVILPGDRRSVRCVRGDPENPPTPRVDPVDADAEVLR